NTVFIETCLPVDPEIMALAGSDHVVITIEPHLCRTAGNARGKSGKTGPLRRLAFLAAKGAAHAAAFARNLRIRHAEHARNEMLHFGRMLGRTEDAHLVILAGAGESDLALQVAMLLAADMQSAAEASPRTCQRSR